MITQELIAALDDLLQAGAQASAKLRNAIEQMAGPRTWERDAVSSSAGVIDGVRAGERNEQTIPQMLTQARDAVSRLSDVAQRIGDTALAEALKMRVSTISAQMQAAGIGIPWLTILGIGAGAVAAYYLWRHFKKKKALAVFESPEEPDVRPRVRQMGRSLGAFRKFGGSSCKPQLGRSGRRLGGTEKYEFEPEVRLEGHHSGGRRTRRSK